MKKLKKFLVIFLFFMLILLVNFKVLANTTSDSGQTVPYSEAYQQWLQLSDEEKQNVLMPRMYDVPYSKTTSKNPLLKSSMLRATLSSNYTLQSVISNNLAIRNQQQTGSCWAFAALSSLETNLALSDYKNGTNTSKVYDFSERHMEYATSRVFNNNQINSMGYNRTVGSGGNWDFASSYLTNGSGAINEADMPFENNEDTIDISLIQGKTVTSQVYDTVEFPDYNGYYFQEHRNEIINEVKNHIQNYGAVFGGIQAGGSIFSESNISSSGTVRVGKGSLADHSISIIGWDDNYSKSNWDEFDEEYRPSSNGAWIARNSWGEEVGDNGLVYISYEDKTLTSSLSGITKAKDNVSYDNIYQYGYYNPNATWYQWGFNISHYWICSVFEKNSSSEEYLTEVSLNVRDTATCKVYVNSAGEGKTKEDLKLVNLKEGESESFGAGYHTLEFAKPVEITSNKFVVAIEVLSEESASYSHPYCVKTNQGAYSEFQVKNNCCFIKDDANKYGETNYGEWIDMATVQCANTIKAFTTNELIDESLKNIEITTPPTKTNYWVGEDFDSSGMVVTAKYNSRTNPSVVLDSSSYSITNGTNLELGQTSVTITYDGKTAEQPIQVRENKVESISITTPPTTTEYWAGEDFDNSGMVVTATYTDETTSTVTDYTITNGSSLKNNQTSITVSYGGKTAEQSITVKANPVVKIEITKEPDKTNYVVGQNFNTSGMVVKATYTNGLEKEITDYEVSDGTNLSLDKTSVTITYEDQSVTQAITVVEKSITQISVKTLPTKTKYIQNKEELDLTGGIIEITYNDDTTEDVDMTSDEVSATGFDYSDLGKVTITLTYLSKTTQFEIEIIEDAKIEENAKNSKMENAVANVKKVKAYYFTNNSQKDYTLIEVEIDGIEKNTSNDHLEYYYFLSANKNENNITDWVKIEENQVENNSIKFTIDTSKISNYNDISNAEVVYLYVKEVATKGGNQSVAITKPMKFETDVEIETYLDNSSNPKKISDETITNGKLPYTGSRTIIIISAIILITVTSIICYKKYSCFRDIK